MYMRFFFLCAVFINSFVLCATEGLDELSQDNRVLSFTSFPVVFGWFQNDDGSKWVVKNKEIKNIDKYQDLYIISFNNNNKKWIAFIKEEKEGSFLIYHTFILDSERYENLITRRESNTILKFPIYKYTKTKVKAKDIVTPELLGITDLSDRTTYPRDFLAVQYKFFKDDTVKFLFYVDQCSAETCQASGLNTNQDYLTYYNFIGSEDLYDTFFYKTTTEYFIKFIDSPIKN